MMVDVDKHTFDYCINKSVYGSTTRTIENDASTGYEDKVSYHQGGILIGVSYGTRYILTEEIL